MQNIIQQLQNEKQEQRTHLESMAAQNNMARAVVPPGHVLLSHQQQVDLSKRSQSL